jgi:DNA (cytosine-5)-methyltransferase 1
MIKVGSDFSGVGAFNQALMRLGIDYDEVFACDMDKYARETFIHNYGEPKYYPKDVYEREIPQESLDIYMTSPPCQAFSLAGKRLGKDDQRGILFFNSHQFIKTNKPRYFIFENVKGLLSDDNGNTFQEWLNMLGGKSVNGLPVLFPYKDSVPYHIYYKVMNAKKHGVPQNRERVFIVGIRDDQDNHFSWAKEKHLTKRLKDILENEVDKKYFLSHKSIQGIINSDFISKSTIIQDKHTYCATLLSRDYKDPKCVKIKSATKKGYEEAKEDDSINFSVPNLETQCNQGILAKYPKLQKGTGNVLFHRKGFASNTQVYDTNKECGTIDTAQGGGRQAHTLIQNSIRRLTPRECFRLMDFPDTFTWTCSDSQAYKQAGNSIVVRCLELIIKEFNLNATL